MKYQIILESDEILADYEIMERAKQISLSGFKVLYAQSLQGIRKEVYEKKEEQIRIERLTDDEIKNIFDV